MGWNCAMRRTGARCDVESLESWYSPEVDTQERHGKTYLKYKGI